MARTSNDQQGRPGLSRIIEAYNRKANSHHKAFMREEETTLTFNQYMVEGDFPGATVVNEAQDITEVDFATPYTGTLRPVRYALVYAESFDARYTDQYNINMKAAKKLAHSIVRATETLTAHQFNSAHDSANPTLYGASAAWANSAQPYNGGTFSNTATAAFGPNALQALVEQLFGQYSHEGDQFDIEGPLHILYSRQLMGAVQRALKASGFAGGNDNDPNIFKEGRFRIVDPGPNLKFTSATRWGLIDSGAKQHWPILLTRGGVRTNRWYRGERDVMKTNAIKVMNARPISPLGFVASTGAG